MSLHFLVATIVFTILYGIFVAIDIGILCKKRTIRTFFSGLFLFGLLRVSAQSCLIGFSAQEFIPEQWLIAYVVLETEAYYLLIIISFIFLVYGSQLNVNGESSLKGRPLNSSRSQLFSNRFRISITALFYCSTVVANVFVVVGGTLLASLNADEYQDNSSRINISKGLRATGQALFLISTLMVIALAARTIILEKIRSYLLVSVVLVAPFLVIRGLYGLIAPFVQRVDYASMANYASTGMSVHFIVTEYILSTTMEFISGCIFLSTCYVTSLHEEQTNQAITADV